MRFRTMVSSIAVALLCHSGAQAIEVQQLGGRQITPRELAGRQITPRQSAPMLNDTERARIRQQNAAAQNGRQMTPRQYQGHQIAPREPGPMLSDAERARIRQQNAAAQDAWVAERARRIDPRGRGLNEAQIRAMEMQRQQMWNATGPGMVYR